MELPSMVQRSGDTLIVRSVVSGNQLYLDQGAGAGNGGVGGVSVPSASHAHSPSPNHHLTHSSSASALEQHLERCRAVAAAQQHHYQQQQQSATQQQAAAAAAAAAVAQQQALELKDEGLPQCKIKRNYSCSYCTYFTQNPRYHLTHLRDVHGEKIVINKCKLCLYASRHFQKLVRHMKMVHGCTDGIAGAHGQSRGKRGMSREARKRKLEQSVGLGGGGVGLAVGAMADSMPKMPTYEQVKREMELQRDIHAFNKQQEEKKHQLSTIFAAAYERELLAQRERELEVSRQQQQQQHQQQKNQQTPSSYDQEAQVAAETQRHQTPPTNNNSNNTSNGSSSGTGFHMSAASHQQPHMASHSVELSPSPTGSASPTAGSATPLPTTSNGPLNNTSAALSLSYVEEPTQNRLLKCSVCDFTTLFRAQLVDHELDEHCKTKFFRCEKCSYVTHIKARFSKHVKYHSMPMIKCVTCDFRTPYKWNLDRHMKNHGGAGPFKCAACDFTADIKQSLTVHEMNHHVPPVGHAAGMSLARRRNKVGGTDLCDDFLSDSAELEDHYNNNNLDDYDDALLGPDAYGKKCKYDEDEPTDLSQKGGSSDTSSVHNQAVSAQTPKAKRPVPNLIPIPKAGTNILNLSKDFAASRSSLTEIASMFFNEKQISEMLQPLEKADAAQLSPTTTIASTSSQNSRNLLQKKHMPGGSFFDKLKSSALASGGPNENLICPCGHTAKCLSESIIHRKACNFAAIADDDIEEEQDDSDDRLEIDFADEDDKQSHSALNLSVTGSTRCQHCRHRCKSSADLLNHLSQCREANRCGNESYDSLSGDSCAGRAGNDSMGEQQHPMENRVFIWNKMPRGGAGGRENSQCSEGQHGHSGGESATSGGSTIGNGTNEENSYYGVETAPGYGEVTKKMTPEEEAANSSLKKVYKCPHCSFWASTASRFHVHIVGHLNKKPFECSLCSYRSNWRWDITKHIRLKTIRDPSHKNARVLMNDETGRRNYTKYNKYITLMKVTEEDGDPKLMKSGEMTPNQVASLSFLNDFNKSVVANVITGTHLNGIKEDITLEPVPVKTGMAGTDADGQLSEGFIRLPLLATMMNAAMAQQQQQQKDHEQQQHATMITPSVTISAVKRSPPPLMKPSDDLVTDVKQEGNEKRTFYKCRKCSFRHANRDAVLAHVKIHYADASFPIVTATATTSPKSSNGAPQQPPQHNTPLQVAVNPNLYMNKVFAAMCLSQQQQNSNSPPSNNAQQPPHSMLSAGLLQQAIQGGAANSSLSGLAMALAGKSPAKATASILEHGEQKASQNEASAQAPTSPTIAMTCLTSSSPSSSPATTQLTASGGGGGSGVGGNGNVGTGGGAGAAVSPSLQHLLTSPRGTYISSAHTQRNQPNSPIISGVGGSDGVGVGTNNNNNLVMGALAGAAQQRTGGTFTSPTTAATTSTPATQQHQHQHQQQALQSSPASSPTLNAAAMSTIVTTLPTTPTSTTARGAANHMQLGFIGASVGGGRLIASSPRTAAGDVAAAMGVGGGSNGDSVCIGGLVYGSNNSTLTCNITSTTTSTPSTTTTTSTSTPSCNLLLSSAQPNAAAAAAAAAIAIAATTNKNTSSSPSSLSSSATNFNNNNSNCNNSSNLLANDGDRRDPSPYRCGHCHQVSNWKHVIQRHCRLKHAGDIRIETLDRTAVGERHAPPIYRPLGNGASNESNYGLTLKALQQQQQQQPPHMNSSSASSNANNSVLMNKAEHLLHSPLAGTAAANAANTPQELQAAAAYIAATYKAAAAAANSGSAAASLGHLSGDELLLHQQLQQNDQIEITRLPATGANGSAAHQQNSKCKQQKCPLCPYISESKSQMNYHVSLHKPTQYECSLCTFVCAKKQHLSSHMRSVHQQHSASNLGAINPMDFGMALQLAAAAQQDSSVLSNPLAIDLTALKNTLNAHQHQMQQAQHAAHHQQQQHQPVAADSPIKVVCHCPKCPARFAQRSRDVQSARADLEEHLRNHSASEGSHYVQKCEFCDFKAVHEPQLQKHRYVHSQHYQDKVNELYGHCREDAEYAAPKLMQITLTKNLQAPETVWIVDNELCEQSKQQHASISSSTNAHFDNGNSLLKKQLESGPVAPVARSSPSPKAAEDGDDSSNMPSTSASVATSDLAVDAGSDFASSVASPSPLEKCQHCPYETKNAALYKAHLQHHICISNQTEEYTCEHCDYSDADKEHIDEHTRVHFNAIEKLKSVAFFTSYDNLELSVERNVDDEVVQAVGEEQRHDTDAEVKKHNAALEDSCSLRIKQEHNNNNEENAINENTLQEQLDGAEEQQKLQERNGATTTPPPAAGDNLKKPCNKIILYKNDGCLSIKRDNSGGVGGNSSENISDRLRRRISRNSSSHLNGGGNGSSTNTNNNNNNDEPALQQSQQQSHKTILVNAKTGQVISRN